MTWLTDNTRGHWPHAISVYLACDWERLTQQEVRKEDVDQHGDGHLSNCSSCFSSLADVTCRRCLGAVRARVPRQPLNSPVASPSNFTPGWCHAAHLLSWSMEVCIPPSCHHINGAWSSGQAQVLCSLQAQPTSSPPLRLHCTPARLLPSKVFSFSIPRVVEVHSLGPS